MLNVWEWELLLGTDLPGHICTSTNKKLSVSTTTYSAPPLPTTTETIVQAVQVSSTKAGDYTMPGTAGTQGGDLCVLSGFDTWYYWYWLGFVSGLCILHVFAAAQAGGHTGRTKAFHTREELDLLDSIPTKGTHQPQEDHPSQQDCPRAVILAC